MNIQSPFLLAQYARVVVGLILRYMHQHRIILLQLTSLACIVLNNGKCGHKLRHIHHITHTPSGHILNIAAPFFLACHVEIYFILPYPGTVGTPEHDVIPNFRA